MTHVFPTGREGGLRAAPRLGPERQASANHPFLTVDGWQRARRARASAAASQCPVEVPAPLDPVRWPDAEVVMLAHLIGDGCVASRQPVHYTSADPANLDAVEQAAAHFGITPRGCEQGNWWHVYLPSPVRLTHGRRNPIQAWLEPIGLGGLRSHEKFIPAAVSPAARRPGGALPPPPVGHRRLRPRREAARRRSTTPPRARRWPTACSSSSSDSTSRAASAPFRRAGTARRSTSTSPAPPTSSGSSEQVGVHGAAGRDRRASRRRSSDPSCRTRTSTPCRSRSGSGSRPRCAPPA